MNRRPLWSVALTNEPFVVACLFVFALLCLLALGAPIFAPQDPFDLAQIELIDARMPPFSPSVAGGPYHLLGTDEQGRDIFSTILFGMRLSLFVAVASAVIALFVGSVIGILAAYFGGWIDTILMRITDIFLSVPTILIALLFIATFGRGVENTIFAIIVAQWTHYARTARASAAGEMSREYVAAARLMDFSGSRIMFFHVLPNSLPPVLVVFTVQLGYAIALEASLSFLGVGLPVTRPSLGSLVAQGQEFLLSGEYWISIIPGCVLLLLVFSANVVADRLRASQNPEVVRAWS